MSQALAVELDWDALDAATEEIPWEDLERAAEALLEDFSSAWPRVSEMYEWSLADGLDRDSYSYLYARAIVELAAARLGDAQAQEVAAWAVDRLIDAGEWDADYELEGFTRLLVALGPRALPALLDVAQGWDDPHGAWFYLWGAIDDLAAGSEGALREQVVEACVKELERAEAGEIDLGLPMEAARTLARMKHQPARNLIESITLKLRDSREGRIFGYGDFREALDLLDGKEVDDRPDHPDAGKPREWLPREVESTRKWYAKRVEEWEEDERFEAPDVAQVVAREPIALPATIRNTNPQPGRNDPCSCGSGKKYKRCCGR